MVFGILSYSQFGGNLEAYKAYLTVCENVCVEGVRASGDWPRDLNLRVAAERDQLVRSELRLESGEAVGARPSGVADSGDFVGRVYGGVRGLTGASDAHEQASVPSGVGGRASVSGSGGDFEHVGRGLGSSQQRAGAELGSDLVGVGRGLPRGPNYLRNQESRMRKKIAKEEKKRAAMSGSWRGGVDDPHAELAQKVRRMRLERQEIQEQRKLDKLRSPTQMIEDAMRQVALAEKYAKLANDSKVAEWAANLSSASAESIAKSAGSSFTGSRVETVNTEYTSPGVKKDRFSVSYFPLTSAERVVVDNRAIRVDKIEDIRRQYGRPLNYGDFMKSNFPHKLDASVRQLVKFAEEEELNNLVGY